MITLEQLNERGKDALPGHLAKATHLGRTTQLWDAIVTHRETSKTIALFRCTQFLIYLKGGA